MALKKLLGKIANEITPSEMEVKEELRLAHYIMGKLQKQARKRCKIALVGSIAKRTFLRESRDIDIFLLFPRDSPKSGFEEFVTALVAKAFPHSRREIRYAEHPYVTMHYEGRRVDVVPAYEIKSATQRLSAVDRSILHTKYVIGKLGKGKLKEVLLLKKFLRSLGIYGAEIRVEGFSGYLCELLIIKYGSFEKLLRGAAKWGGQEFVDIEKAYKKAEAPYAIRKLNSHFIVIDPTDRERNVSAAVSGASMKKFRGASKAFLKSPAEKFFLAPKTFEEKIRGMKNKKGKTYIISLPAPSVVDDVLWGQLKRLSKQLLQFLHSKDFEVLETEMESTDKTSSIAVRVKESVLGDKKLLFGPAVKLEKNVSEFKKAHRGEKIEIRKGRIVAHAKREIASVEAAIKKFFDGKNPGIPSHYAKGVKNYSLKRP